eukprot:m51a1_g8525 hypothetical protein (269) ;mRNA; r:120240-121276
MSGEAPQQPQQAQQPHAGQEGQGAPQAQEAYGYAARAEYVSGYWRAKYEREAGRYWERFYAKPRGYLASSKDRAYLVPALAHLLAGPRAPLLLEVGCGGGHSVAPLARAFPAARFVALDISRKALDVLRANPDVPADRVEAHAIDVAAPGEAGEIGHVAADGSVDVALAVFVLSAIAPALWPNVARRLHAALRPGGALLFRDYAEGDECQVSFDAQRPPRKLAPNYYVLDEVFVGAGFAVAERTPVRIDKFGGPPRLFLQVLYRKPPT